MRALINSLKIFFSFLLSSATGKPFIWGMPPALGIELTNNCNLRCPECLAGSGRMQRERGFMSRDLFAMIIPELKPYLFNINLYFQGEPMLHPAFFDFVSMAKGTRITVSTNGHFLTDENVEKIVSSGIKKIIVSLDGMDQQTYSAFRAGGDFSRVAEGIKKLVYAIKRNKHGPEVEIQFLVNRMNEHQIREVKRFTRETGIKLRLKSMQIISPDNHDKWLPAEEKYRRYFWNGNEFRIKSRMVNRCLRLWLNPVITWDGHVLPCCFDKDASHSFGKIGTYSFREIWHGKSSYEFRKGLLSDRSATGICRNCTSGMESVAV